MHMPWLSLAIWVPILFGVVTLLLGRDGRDGLARMVALVGAIAGFVVTNSPRRCREPSSIGHSGRPPDQIPSPKAQCQSAWASIAQTDRQTPAASVW